MSDAAASRRPPAVSTLFTVTSTAGHALAGTLTLPAAAAGGGSGRGRPAAGGPPCALLLHGLNSHRDDTILPALAEALADRGVASLRYDAVGNGGSAGPFAFANYAEEAADALEAAAALQRADARGGRVVAVAGHSKAGTVAVLAAAAAPKQIPVLVSIAGRFDLAAGLEARFGADLDGRVRSAGAAGLPITWPSGGRGGPRFTWRLTAADLAARRGPAAVDVGAACARLPATTRFLHVHGAADETIPASEAARYAHAARHCEVADTALIEGGDHNFTDPAAAAAAVDVIAGFIARHAV
jgi:dipeptidyl aminopeptidase/acylaminoacyl peptidase